MSARWPQDLPGPIGPGYVLTPFEQSIRTDMEVGPARVRRISTARRDRLSVQWRFTDAEMGAFRAWFGSEAWSLAGDSDDLSSWSVLGTSLSVGPGTIAGPGGVTPTRLIESAADEMHRLRFYPALEPRRRYWIAATVRSAGRRYLALSLGGYGPDGGGRILIDTATGAVPYPWESEDLVVRDRGGGWLRVSGVMTSGSGDASPYLFLTLFDDQLAGTYPGDGESGVDVCELTLLPETLSAPVYLPTDADGAVRGAAGGSGWFVADLSFGGGQSPVEARFAAPFRAEALSGLNWQVSADLEVRHA